VDKEIKPKKPRRPVLVIGWMEHLDLPELGLSAVKAKIDTGARTSALHAMNVETFQKQGVDWVRFQTRLGRSLPIQTVEAPIRDRRKIRNTSGVSEARIIIRTRLQLTDRSWTISVSLADRSNMRFPMIVGRTALKDHNIAVHTRRANLTKSIGQQCL